MYISKNEIEKLALEKYPKNECLSGTCSGIKTIDKNEYERKIWIDSFNAALEIYKAKR